MPRRPLRASRSLLRQRLVDETLEVVNQLLAAEQKPALRHHPRAKSTLNRLDETVVPQADLLRKRHHLGAQVGGDVGREELGREPAVDSGPSGIHTSSDMFIRPGSMLIVRFGQTR